MSDQDLDEIREVFFEESAEGLQIMETGLLGLDMGAADLESVNNIFRAAHSIKGGAGTFGFGDVSEFTHGVETILDQIRSEEREVTEDAVQLLLESVDYIGALIDAIQNNTEADQDTKARLENRISVMLADVDNDTAAADDSAKTDTNESSDLTVWTITFKPSHEILLHGIDPKDIFQELKAHGELEIESDLSDLPTLDNLDAEELYIGWTLSLTSNCSEEDLQSVFETVKDHCEVEITCSEEETEIATDNATQLAENEKKGKAKKPPAKKNGQSKGKKASTESASIRVGIDKIDALLNLVGELVINQSFLRRFGDTYNPDQLHELRDGLNQLERHTRELQASAMQIRMLPISASFSRFPRLVRDLSSTLGKKIELVVSGESTEVDKTVLEKLSDPLVHLVRNSIDHGIESPEERVKSGKKETGTLHLSAAHEGGNVVVRVEDDGAGLNREKILTKAIEKGLINPDDKLSDDRIDNLIFHPGFSTADNVSDVSGRGVGMDVVLQNIRNLGGRVRVSSDPGKGTCLVINLPLTLAILDGQLVRIGQEIYVLSLLSIVETVLIRSNSISTVGGSGQVYRLRDCYIPVFDAASVFGVTNSNDGSGELLVIVESEGVQFGLIVDELLEQQQIVIKGLEHNFRKMPGLTGATILGDGTVALILDVPGMLSVMMQSGRLTRVQVDEKDAA